MYTIIKYCYYNAAFVFIVWLLLLLYKINFWLSVIGAIIITFIYFYITPKVLNFLKEWL